MTERKAPTEESLRRHGFQHFGQEKRRFLSPANSMTNIAFRAIEIVTIVSENVVSGATNYLEGYETDLKCINNPLQTCNLRVLENGQFVLVSSEHELTETVSIGRNNQVLGIMAIQNNRININNECEFGSFPLNQNNEHVAVLLPHGKRPELVKSEFLHIEFAPYPVMVQFEVSVDGGLYLDMVLTQVMLAFQRFDSASLSLTLAQMFRSIAFEELKKIRNIYEFVHG